MKEMILICGIQGAGKSTIVKEYEDKGYKRLNRDSMGGSLEKLNAKLEAHINDGKYKFVMDNTYGNKENRGKVLSIGKKYGIPVKCIWLQTKIEDAQFNVSGRILKTHFFYRTASSPVTDLLGPNGYKICNDIVPSIALYAYKKSFVAPTMDEGFSDIAEVKFVREVPTKGYTNKAILLDYDGTLRVTKSGNKYPVDPKDISILPNRKKILKKYFM